MKSLRILLVADDLKEANKLSELLTDMGHRVSTLISSVSVELLYFAQSLPDLIILDIDLVKNKQNRAELADAIEQMKRIPLICLTAFPYNAAIEPESVTASIPYLLKPYDHQQLKKALERTISDFRSSHILVSKRAEPNQPFQGFKSNPKKDYFFLKQKDRYVKLKIVDIKWVKAANNDIWIHTAGQPMKYGISLKKFCLQIIHPDLLRIHKSYLVNLQHIDAFGDGLVYIPDGSPIGKRIPIGEQYKSTFLSRITKLKT
ncbi:MAG: LytTR family transcriptional regulator DNA-binding domain-containing protein [Bacteroidota bacterium]